MATGLPGKIISAIQKDVQRDSKKAKTPWQGFGPIAEGSLTKSGNGAVVAWRFASTAHGTKCSYMVGGYVKTEDGWKQVGETQAATGYDAGSQIGVEATMRTVTKMVNEAEGEKAAA